MIKKLGLTQRVTLVEQYGERRDSLDQRWWKLVEALDFIPAPLPNLPSFQVDHYLSAMDLSAIILTGGESDPARDSFENSLIQWAMDNKRPVVGICHGMQMLNQFFGGSLVPLTNHVAIDHPISFCNEWGSLSPRTVNSYHEYGLFDAQLAEPLEATALHADGSIEAFIHPKLKIAGIMWHPERETVIHEPDLDLLKGLLS